MHGVPFSTDGPDDCFSYDTLIGLHRFKIKRSVLGESLYISEDLPRVYRFRLFRSGGMERTSSESHQPMANQPAILAMANQPATRLAVHGR